MEITVEIKQRIIEAIKENRDNYPSNNKHAAALGISTSVYSDLINGKIDRKMSDTNWICVARRLNVSLNNEMEWKVAQTPTFIYIMEQLTTCQLTGVSSVLCDMPNIGKTFTARYYVKTHKNAIYVDCAQVKTKQRLVRFIAKEFGVNSTGRYYDVYDDLAFYLKTLETPLIILDEAGDLQYEAFLELKGLWNATERCCAWYMMGADGLKAKINRSIEFQKVGYTEMLSRYSEKYNKVTPDDGKERETFLKAQAAMVVKLNAPEGTEIMRMVNRTGGSLRRVYTEIELLRKAQ